MEIECQNETKRGYIRHIITKTSTAERVKVELKSGEIGYVEHLVTRDEMKMEQLKYYNHFLYAKTITSIWDKKASAYLVSTVFNERRQQEERVAYLFTDPAVAERVLSTLDNTRFMIRSINRSKRIDENFKTLDHTHYRINEERKITVNNLNEREKEFILTTPNRKGKRRR